MARRFGRDAARRRRWTAELRRFWRLHEGCSYVHAEGEASYQSKRDTTIYAYGDGANLLAGAKNNIALASGGNTLVQGSGGLVIAGGVNWGMSPEVAAAAAPTIAPPDWIAEGATTAGMLGNLWSGADTLAAAVSLGVSIARSRTGTSSAWDFLASGLGAISGGLNIGGFFDWKPFAGTVIHGDAGLVMGTGGTMGLYSGLGTNIVSPIGVSLMSANAVSIDAIREVAIQSVMKTTIGGRTTKVAALDSAIFASRTSEAQLLGKTITIGGPDDMSERQLATLEVICTAENKVSVESDHIQLSAQGFVTGGSYHSSNPLGIELLSKTRIYADSEEFVSRQRNAFHLAVNDTFGVSADQTKISIGKVGGKEQHVTPGEGPGITIDSAEIRHGVNGWGTHVTDGSASIGGARSYVKVTDGKVVVKGSKMKLF